LQKIIGDMIENGLDAEADAVANNITDQHHKYEILQYITYVKTELASDAKDKANLAAAQTAWQKSLSEYMAKNHPDMKLTPADKQVLWEVHSMPGGWRQINKGDFEEVPDDYAPSERVLSNGKKIRVRPMPGASINVNDTVVVKGIDGGYRLSTVRIMHNGEKGVAVGNSAQNKAKKEAAIAGGIDAKFYDELALVGVEGDEVKDYTASAAPDSASDVTTGGIDDREGLMRMEIQSDGTKIPMFKNMPVDIQNFSGFSFKIVSIQRSRQAV